MFRVSKLIVVVVKRKYEISQPFGGPDDKLTHTPFVISEAFVSTYISSRSCSQKLTRLTALP